MNKIMFNDKYGLTKAVLQGRKTMTRRMIADKDEIDAMVYARGSVEKKMEYLLGKSRYKIGEVVAVAQNYHDVYEELKRTHGSSSRVTREFFHKYVQGGRMPVSNKMFVRADLMPHQIRITNIKVERLQDCSDDDILKEGIYRWKDMEDCPKSLSEIQRNRFGYYGVWDAFSTPRKAFADLIDKPGVGGKGTWERNPWVVVYTFKLVK